MPRVTPSQVTALIEQMFPITVDEERYTKIELTPQSVSGLQVIVDLVEDIPPELITLEGTDYINLRTGMTALKPKSTEGMTMQQRNGR